MRIRLPLGRSLFFLIAFLIALAASFPLRLALDWLALGERGLAAREARGSVWNGVLTEAQIGALALGDLGAGLQRLPLALGRARIDLERLDEARRMEGALTVSRHRFGVDDVSGAFDAAPALAPLPVSALDLNDLSAHFADGLCVAAEGRVRATVAAPGAGLALPGGFSGNARCDQGALLLPMASQTGTERLDLRLTGDGRYRIELLVRPLDDAMRDRLIRAGFAAAASGYVLRASGQL